MAPNVLETDTLPVFLNRQIGTNLGPLNWVNDDLTKSVGGVKTNTTKHMVGTCRAIRFPKMGRKFQLEVGERF